MENKLYSVIIPIKDEEENLTQLVKELNRAFESLNLSTSDWEVLCIDDGSTDRSLEILNSLKEAHPHLRVLSFVSNRGQSTAFYAGFREAKGTWVITIDADLQNDPGDIPKLLEFSDEFDLVCGWRTKRKDTSLKRLISKLANFFRSRLCDDGVHDTGCSLKRIRRSSILNVPWFHGAHRFIPALLKSYGYKICEVPVNHRPRQMGHSKYNIFNRSIGPLVDLLGMMWLRKRRIVYEVKQSD